jgi:glycosyltransferase involved in cell wall biosynthesis
MNNRVTLDGRWEGNFGIGRYSREILSRFNIGGEILKSRLMPTHPMELVKSAIRLDIDSFYSPGYIPIRQARKQIITIHDLIPIFKEDFSRRDQLYFKALRHYIQNNSVFVITVSEHSKKVIADWAGLNPQEITLAPPGLSKAFLKDFNFKLRETKSLGFVGSLKSHKNFELFVRVVNLLPSDWKIHVVGVVPSANYGFMREVVFHQNLTDEQLASVYESLGFVFIPSLQEGFCMPALEATALGSKVLHLGIVPSIQEILGDLSINMFGNSKDLCIVERIIEEEKNSNSYSADSIDLLRSKFSWDVTAGVVSKKILEML